jgi:hypothetical protein
MVGLSLFLLFLQITWGQVGIGTDTPHEALEVNGKIRMTGGSVSEGKILVSDVNGTASWENAEKITDGVITKVIRKNGAGDIVLWTHPEGTNGIEVIFNTNTKRVRVENKTGDIGYWDVVINGGGLSNNDSKNTKYKYKFIYDDGVASHKRINFDIDSGANNRGWFEVIASDQSDEIDGFIIKVVYYDEDINGMVQYWDGPDVP